MDFKNMTQTEKEEWLKNEKDKRYNNILEYWKKRKPFKDEDDINGCPKVLPKDYQDIMILTQEIGGAILLMR